MVLDLICVEKPGPCFTELQRIMSKTHVVSDRLKMLKFYPKKAYETD